MFIIFCVPTSGKQIKREEIRYNSELNVKLQENSSLYLPVFSSLQLILNIYMRSLCQDSKMITISLNAFEVWQVCRSWCFSLVFHICTHRPHKAARFPADHLFSSGRSSKEQWKTIFNCKVKQSTTFWLQLYIRVKYHPQWKTTIWPQFIIEYYSLLTEKTSAFLRLPTTGRSELSTFLS